MLKILLFTKIFSNLLFDEKKQENRKAQLLFFYFKDVKLDLFNAFRILNRNISFNGWMLFLINSDFSEKPSDLT